MRCEVTGKVVEELERRVGKTSEGKRWESRTYLLRTNEFREKLFKFKVNAYEESMERQWLEVGKIYEVKFSVEAKSYEGKWYNHVTAWGVKEVSN